MNMTRICALFALSLLILGCSPPGSDSTDEPTADASTEDFSTADGGETSLYWGDTHLHTSYSFDAYGLGNRSTDPNSAYRFAKGMPVVHPGHRSLVKIDRPLDFLVVTDHAEFLGVVPEIAAGNPQLLTSDLGRLWHEMLTTPGRENEFFNDFVARGSTDPASIAFLSDEGIVRTVWSKIVDAAERHNDPGTFTAFSGWEWSSAPGGLNLHRIVFTPDGKDKAMQYLPYSLLESEKPRDLWNFLARTAEEFDTDFVAIGHNANISNGRFFPLEDEFGEPVNADYAEQRRRWEPVVEMTQYKGDSETHPILSPSDEFADFERYKHTLDGAPVVHEIGSYVRSGLLRGLKMESELGINPYKFGMIGATDSHTGMSAAEEGNFLGKYAQDSTPENKAKETVPGSVGWDASAMGLAGVWASENTRDAITAAFRRKEVYATTGPRIQLRVFGGWEFNAADAEARDFAANGYANGVPMGGDLTNAPEGQAPTLLISATKDPLDGNLDRVQVVKGWIGADGNAEEHIYDVVWSGDREPDSNGRLPSVGNTVSLDTGRYENSIGATRLTSVWADPDFDPALRAFYYIRV
ncbi:MAG: DUF3604 domain-containing protein, partial [Woeseiaceae bacterium]